MRRAREAQQAAYETSRTVLGKARARRDAAWRDAAAANRRRAALVLLSPLAVGVLLGALGVLSIGLGVAGAVVFLCWAGVAAWSWRYVSRGAAGTLGGDELYAAVSAGVVSRPGAERVEDLTEGLCAALGLPLPEIRVLGDPAPNAVSLGSEPSTVVLVVTAGLVDGLDRIELEAALAHELCHVKRLDVLTGAMSGSPATRILDACSGGRASRALLGSLREVEADLAACSVIRYPPGLVAALDRIAASASTEPSSLPEAVRRRTAGLWLAPFAQDGLAERLDVLREL
jgi:Zn-dependent protease with chaperone function